MNECWISDRYFFLHLLRWSFSFLYFSFVNVMYYVDWFANVELSLWTWDESHLVRVYNLFLCVVGFGMLIFCWEFLHLYSKILLSFSHVQLFRTPWTVAHQAPLSTGFPRQEYWSGVPFSSPEHLPDPEIEPMFPVLAGRFFTSEPPKKLHIQNIGL